MKCCKIPEVEKGSDNTISNKKKGQTGATYGLKFMLSTGQKTTKWENTNSTKTINGSELRVVGCVSCFCSISVICYKFRNERLGLLPRQKEHTHDYLWNIYSIILNQVMLTSLFCFPVINCTIKSRCSPILNTQAKYIITNIFCIQAYIKNIF